MSRFGSKELKRIQEEAKRKRERGISVPEQGDLVPEREVRGVEDVINVIEDAKTSPPTGAGLVGKIQAEVDDPAGSDRKKLHTLTDEKLRQKSRKELYHIAQDLNIAGRSTMKKDKLIKEIIKVAEIQQAIYVPTENVSTEANLSKMAPAEGDKPQPPSLTMIRDEMSDEEKKATEQQNKALMNQYELQLADYEAKHQLLVNELKLRKELDSKGITSWETQNNIVASIIRADKPEEVRQDVLEEKKEKIQEIEHQLAPEPQVGTAQNITPSPYQPLELIRNPQGVIYERKYQEVNDKESKDIDRGNVVLRDIERKVYQPTLDKVAKEQNKPLKKGITPLGSVLQKSFNRMSIWERRLHGFDQSVPVPITESNTVTAYKSNIQEYPKRFGIIGTPVGSGYADDDALNNDYTDGLRLS